jgi:hypothetical protein
MMACGGVHGKDVGINLLIIVQAGSAMRKFPFFINKYPQAGGMIIRSATGKGIHGITSGYPTSRFNKTGRAGKKINIGKLSSIGVSRACIRKRSQNSIRIRVSNIKRISRSNPKGNRESITMEKEKNKKRGVPK